MSRRRPPVPRPLLAAGVLGGLALVGTACRVDLDLGDEVTRTFEVTDFDEVEITSAFDVLIEVGEEPSLEITVHEQVEDRLRVDQEGDRLTIGFDGGLFTTSGDMEIRITTPDLSRLELDGAVSAEVIDLAGPRLELDLDGASSVRGRGSVGVLVIDTDGAARVDFDRVTADLVEVDADGASSIEVRGAAEVTGQADGASSIDVSADAITRLDTEGASSVDRSDD